MRDDEGSEVSEIGLIQSDSRPTPTETVEKTAKKRKYPKPTIKFFNAPQDRINYAKVYNDELNLPWYEQIYSTDCMPQSITEKQEEDAIKNRLAFFLD